MLTWCHNLTPQRILGKKQPDVGGLLACLKVSGKTAVSNVCAKGMMIVLEQVQILQMAS